MSQYASAMNTRSGWAALTRPISAGQYSSAGAGPARSPQVRANTSLVISIAMSQRSPSHCSPMSISVSATASRSSGGERVELHDVGPRREVRVAAARDDRRAGVRRNAAGSRARSSSVPATKQLGPLGEPRMVGRDVVGHVVEDQPEAARGELPRAPRPAPSGPPKRSSTT